ncbi:MauE/DoxX family redox-associated membrane protein [Novosphingobium decolorationis]|uniref:Methylamine utilization protein MauE n=1 Tax=Novosphingobium decolorationis TaxID=2698673 RepID=A0ABX8E801_9SPHN|nr:MauE/DoxX family redox-associated membrane protein [Novosphingobium decolorationis]QVM85320.1 methylamine utilization protein MauE [Novosphingobium decolorationis]
MSVLDTGLLLATGAGALRFGTALLLVGAVLPKLRNRSAFAGVVANYKLLPRPLVGVVAGLLPWLELALAAALLVPLTASLAAFSAALLLTLFAAAIAINISRGRAHIDCGCRGDELRQPLRAGMVVRNFVWAVLLIGSAGIGGLAPASMAQGLALLVALTAGMLGAVLLHILEIFWALPARRARPQAGG